ncbi:hypothetical protein [Paenibacillus sp. FSL R7-269]|uniref:hypothetical protein n=1 Tax=Paenibacillus sp. FSL R7-269 TaxID=1226755 RepID=UPI001F288058|nr:hypothetical protein [Paenibacillus sp. FSL R7-269]
MKQPKLVLVEGLPGYGKSTTAQLVYEILTEMNVSAQLVLEGNLDHPADYDGVACLTKQNMMSCRESAAGIRGKY